MIKIVYDGENIEKLIEKIPKFKEFVILDSYNYEKINEKGFIYCIDRKEDIDRLYNLNKGFRVLNLNNKMKIEKARYKNIIFISKIEEKKAMTGDIFLYGESSGMINFIQELLIKTNMCIGIRGEKWRIDNIFYKVEKMKSERFYNQLQLGDDQNLIIHMEQNKGDGVKIFFWNGDDESLYNLKRRFNESDLYDFIIIQSSSRKRDFYKQNIIHGNYIGKLYNNKFLSKLFWNKNWNLIENQNIIIKEKN